MAGWATLTCSCTRFVLQPWATCSAASFARPAQGSAADLIADVKCSTAQANPGSVTITQTIQASQTYTITLGPNNNGQCTGVPIELQVSPGA